MSYGKDGRILSAFQEAPWMRAIAIFRKYKDQARGEASGVSKLIAGQVIIIRHPKKMTRKLAEFYSERYGISVRWVYYLRSTDPKKRKWKHLDLENN